MYKLVIDTCSRICQVALIKDDHTISHLIKETSMGIGEILLDLIIQLISNHCKKEDLSEIYVTVGPGSFTGVRIGIATALGLKLGLGIPLFGISSFKAHAKQKNHPLPALVILDAKRQDFYVQEFDENGVPVDIPLNISLETLTKMFKDRSYFVCGDYVQDTQSSKWVLDKSRFLDPLIITQTKPEQGTQPLYVRPPDVGLPKK